MSTTTVKYIPEPDASLLKLLAAGKPSGDIHLMTLIVPDEKGSGIRELKMSIDKYRSKDALASMYQPFISSLKKGGITVKLTGDESSVNRYSRLLTKIADKQQLLKYEYTDLAVLFEWIQVNMLEMFKHTVSETDLDLMRILVADGGMDIHDIATRLHIDMRTFSPWEYNRDYSRWAKDAKLKTIRRLTDSIPCKYESSSYDNSVWLMPRPDMIALVLDSESVAINSVRQLGDDHIPENHTIFSISTTAGSAAVLAINSMMETGVLVNGRTKINAGVIKKVTEAVNLPQLPTVVSKCVITETPSILAHLMLLGNYGKGQLSVKSGFSGMKECLMNADPQLENYLVSRSLSSVPPSLRYILTNTASAIYAALNRVNKIIGSKTGDDWYDMKSFRDTVTLTLTMMGYGFVPTRYYEWLGKFKLDYGSVMPASDVKSRYFDVMLDSVILSFAAMGGYDFLVSDGKAVGLRLTQLGQWLSDQKSEFPVTDSYYNKENDFEVDDALMLIRVRNQSSPFITTLKEFADPVMANRYRLSDAKLLKGCRNEADLNSRIDQLKDFVIGNPGPHITEHFNKLALRFKSVVPTPGGTSYKLFDIRSDDRNLLRILTEDPDIIHNSLRVEGCRLLIRTSFLPKFVEKLRTAGYPIII